MKHWNWTLWLLVVIGVLGLVGCSAQQDDPEPSEGPVALTPMVMVNDTLYLDTGYDSAEEARCGTLDGEITSTVPGSERPTENDQSNFGDGYGYQYGFQEGTIEVCIDDAWRIFATEAVREGLQFPAEEG